MDGILEFILSNLVTIFSAPNRWINFKFCQIFQTFLLYPYLEDTPLDAGKALSTLALFNVLRLPTILFTAFINSLINANVSAKRLMPYLLADDAEGLNTQDKTKTQSIGVEAGDRKVGISGYYHL